MSVGPGGGLVGPGGALVGPPGLLVPSGLVTLAGGIPVGSFSHARAVVGPGGGRVGPDGGRVGPGPGFVIIAAAPSGIISLTGGVPSFLTPGGSILVEGPNPDQAPGDDSWVRSVDNPIIGASEIWEGDRVRAGRVLQRDGFYRLWYSGGDSPEAIGYASCPEASDPSDPANWTKDPANPIIGAGAGGEAGGAGLPAPFWMGLYRLTYVNDAGQIMLTSSVDGHSGWSTPVALTFDASGRVFEITAPPQGGWPWCNAFSSGGHTYIGYTDNAGGVFVEIYNQTTGAKTRSTLANDGTFTHDQHIAPAILERSSDHRLIAAYSDHGGPGMWIRVTVNPITTDPTISGGWQTAANIDGQLGGTAYTYPNLMEVNGEIVLTYRDQDGVNNWERSHHALDTSNLATGWAHFTNVFFGTRAYGRAYASSPTRIDWVCSDGSWAPDHASAYHLYEEAGVYYKTDGTPMPGSPPFAFSDMTKIYDGATAGVRWPKEIVKVGDDVAVAFTVQTGTPGPIIGQDEDYIWAISHAGGAWATSTLASGVGAVTVEFTEAGLTIDPNDVFHVVYGKRLVSDVTSEWRLFDARTSDDGATWVAPQRTFTGPSDCYPQFVLHYSPELPYVWLSSPNLTSSTNFSQGIHGYGIPPGDAIVSFGGRDIWREGGTWKMLATGINAAGRPLIYYAESADGLAWTIERGGAHYGSLQVAVDGATASPRVRIVDGVYQLWFHAADVAGNLATDLYRSTSTDLTADAWTTPVRVLTHSGAGFEIDQVADPDILVGTGSTLGIAFLFFDGQDNAAATGAVGIALALSAGGITVTIGDGDRVTSDVDLLFDIGAITSEITLPIVFKGPDVTSDITLPFDLRGDVFSEITLPFDILGPVTSDITLPFDILDTEIVGGAQLRGIPPLWRPLMVFDKAGVYLGSINPFNVSNPPVRYLRSKTITNEGGMTFNVPRQSGDMGLIADDRLVHLQSPRGEKPWWGTMSVQPDARGIHEVTNKDPFTLLRDGRGITLKEDVNDGTPATAVMAKLMAIHNDLRALNGEVQWELDLQGSRPFRGDIDFDGDTLTCIDIILKRSRTEVAWDSRLEGNRLVPILRMRDRFDAGAGADIFDGPNGNVTAGVQVVEDPTTLVFRLRLRGLTTDLAACLPEWAQWALLDITPEVTVEVDPGAYRMREVRDESVDWGLSKAAIAAQCNAILDWLWGLYRSYLRALHDIEGRPNHEGWAYVGPPDIYEPKSAGKDSLSRRAWRTRLQLVEVRDNEPASAVMISEGHSQINLREWLIVRYNRVTGVQNVTVWAIETAKGVELIKWNLTGSATLYHVSGERIIGRSTITTTGAFVDPYNTRIYDPVAKRYRELRRIINGPFALAYYVDPADADNAFVDLGVDAAISTTAGDGSSLISKMYDFERFAIENWDPRRDGIGARLSRPTVFFGEPTTRPRWHVVSFDVGGDASTQLTHGIGASAPGVANDIEVDSIFGFPDPDLEPGAFPFLISIDDGMDEEDVLVLSMTGTLWHVLRGQNGTAAIIHEAGAPVKRFGADAWPGFPFPYTWPEGEQWAAEELAELSKPRIDVNVHVAHFRDDQLTIDYGSSHAVDVATEGAPGRWTGTGRIIGWSTDPGHNPTPDDPTPPGGETEVVLEWQQ